MHEILRLFTDLDGLISDIIQFFGVWTYVILFLVIFCETGLVVTPFLPGDSLLFAAGAIVATNLGHLDPVLMYVLLSAAAILGDNSNFRIGYFIGPKVFHKDTGRLINKEHLVRTQSFFEKYGPQTVIIAKFMPIIRTFSPFVAGVGRMKYLRFFAYDTLGGLLWTTLFFWTGYFFGEQEFVKKNFELIIYAIVAISLVPAIVALIRSKMKKKTV